MTPRWVLFAFAGCVVLAYAYSSIHAFRRRKGFATTLRGSRLPPRLPPGQARWSLLSQAAIGGVLASEVLLGPWQPADLGFSAGITIPLTLVGGAGVYLGFVALFEAVARVLHVRSRFEDLNFLALRAIWPRSRREKPLAFLAVCILNPWTEEIVYRGVLIFALGHYLGGFAIPIILGFALTLVAHLYQGPLAFVSHLFLFGTIVLILFSPLGLGGAIGFHLLADLVPVVTFRRQMFRWRTHRRSSREAPLQAA